MEMRKVQISFSTNPVIRDSAMNVAKKLGLSLSAFLNIIKAWLLFY